MLKEYEEKNIFWGEGRGEGGGRAIGVRRCRWEEDWGEIFFFFFF